MGQLTITLPDELEEKVREFAAKESYGSVSDFVREVIREKTNQPSYWQRFLAVMTLENNKLLHKLLDESWEGNEELLEGLRSGYVSEYSKASYIVNADEFSEENAKFVFDVLHMFDRLQLAAKKIGESNLSKQVVFEGFDGNNETSYLAFVRFLVKNGNFTFVKPLDKKESHNSHIPMIHVYKRMLDVFKPLEERYGYMHILSKEQLKAVLSASVHPENRK